MPRTVITHVALARADGVALVGGYFDEPKPGVTATGPEVELSGWVVGAAGPAAAVEVRFRGEVLRTARVELPRSDVAGVFRSRPWAAGSGFRLTLPVPGGLGSHDLLVRAVFGSGARPLLGSVRLTVLPDEPTPGSAARPVTTAPPSGPAGPAPDPRIAHPVAGNRACGFLKNLVRNPNIVVGDYTFYADAEDAGTFEQNVLYPSDHVGDRLIIGKFCSLARGVKFLMNGANHLLDRITTYPFASFGGTWGRVIPTRGDMPYRGDTVVGNDVWIGYDALVLPGVQVGDGAVIAARAVVARDVPPYTVTAGNPARPVRQRFPDDIVRELLAIRWWDWPIEKITRNLETIAGSDVAALRACE